MGDPCFQTVCTLELCLWNDQEIPLIFGDRHFLWKCQLTSCVKHAHIDVLTKEILGRWNGPQPMVPWGNIDNRVAIKWFRSWQKCLNGSCLHNDRPMTPGFLELEFNCQKFLNVASGKTLVVSLHQSNNTWKGFLSLRLSYSCHMTLRKGECKHSDIIIDWSILILTAVTHSSERASGRGFRSCIPLQICGLVFQFYPFCEWWSGPFVLWEVRLCVPVCESSFSRCWESSPPKAKSWMGKKCPRGY